MVLSNQTVVDMPYGCKALKLKLGGIWASSGRMDSSGMER